MKNKAVKFIQNNATWVILIILYFLFCAISPNFGTVKNFITILRQTAVTGIAAVGFSIVLISGGFDLSIGSQAAVSGMVCSLLLTKLAIPAIPAMIIAVVLTAVVFGLFNGGAIAVTGMPDLICTLGTMNIARGVALLLNGGFTVYGLPEPAKILGQHSIGPIPICVIALVVSLILGDFILRKTVFGRLLFAVGSNKEASRLSGVPVKTIKILSYIVGGLFVCFAGVVLMSRNNSGIPTVGDGIYLEVLAGCIIGGISPAGGSGNTFKMLGGILIMSVISNGMNVAGISEFWQYISKGGILVASVGIDSFRALMASEKTGHMIKSAQKEHETQAVS